MAPYNGARTKVQLKLTIQRCKMLQDKKEAMAKQNRREIAALIEKGKLETARIKTEGIISEDIHLELLELMELYAETLLARFAILDLPTREPDPSIAAAMCAIIHAAPRTELKELHVLRELLMSKYGREFSQDVMDNKDNCVPDRVMNKLVMETPDPKLVDLYIYEICKTYDVPFSSEHLPETLVPPTQEEAQEEDEVEAQTPGEDEKKSVPNEESKTTKDAKPTTKEKASSGSTTAAPTTTNTTTTTTASNKKMDEKNDYDDLEARFAALKRR